MPASAPSERDLAVLRSFARRIDPSDAGAHNNLGVLYYQKGLLDDAIEQFTRALELDSRMQVAQANLELACQESGTFERRVAELEARLARTPDDREVRWALGRTYATLGHHAEAVREFEALLRWHPTDVPALLQLGQAEKARGRLDAATEWFQRAMGEDPSAAQAFVALGETLYQRGRPEEALGVLEDAARRFPDHADAHHLLSFLYGDLGRHEEARGAARTATRLNPSLARAQANLVLPRAERRAPEAGATPGVVEGAALTHYALGLAFRQKGKYPEAMGEYRQALDAGEDPRLAMQGLAEVHLLRRELQPALDAYEQLVERFPDSPKLWNEQGVCLQHLGLRERAEASYREALLRDDGYALAWNNLAVALAAVGRIGETREALQAALTRAPKLTAARLNLALAHARSGDGGAALAAYQDVLASEPDNAIAWNGVGLMLMEGQRLTEARTAFQRAIEADETLAAAHYNLSFTQSRLGEHDAALHATRRALELEPYYVPQKFALAIDVQYEHPTIFIPPAFGGDEPLQTASGFALDRAQLDDAFAALEPAPAPQAPAVPADETLAEARAHLDAGRLDRAVVAARQVRTPVAAAAAAATLLGDVFARRGLHGEALERYRTALTLMPTDRGAAVGALRAQLALGRGAAAAAEAHEAARRFGEDAEVQALAARVQVAARDTTAAFARARAAVTLAPRSPDALDSLAEAHEARGEREAAVGALRRALDADPAAANRWLRLGELESARGDVPAARSAFGRALSLLPTFADAAVGLARLELERGTSRAAVRVLAEVLAADPFSTDALAVLGRALLADGRADAALAAADRALRFDPAHAEALLVRGEALARQRHFGPAIDAWERLLASEPAAPVAAEARTRLRAARELQQLFAQSA